MSEHCTAQQERADFLVQEQHRGHDHDPHMQHQSVNKHSHLLQHQEANSSDCDGSDCCPAICAATLLPANNPAALVRDNAIEYSGFLSRIPLSHPELLLRPPIV